MSTKQHPYSWSIFLCSCFSLQFSSNSLQLSDSRSVLNFRAWPVISRMSSRGSGAGWSCTEPKCTFRKERKKKNEGGNESARPTSWYIATSISGHIRSYSREITFSLQVGWLHYSSSLLQAQPCGKTSAIFCSSSTLTGDFRFWHVISILLNASRWVCPAGRR